MALSHEVVRDRGVGCYITPGLGDGRYWVRISASFFSEREDYIKLRDCLVEKCKEWGGNSADAAV